MSFFTTTECHSKSATLSPCAGAASAAARLRWGLATRSLAASLYVISWRLKRPDARRGGHFCGITLVACFSLRCNFILAVPWRSQAWFPGVPHPPHPTCGECKRPLFLFAQVYAPTEVERSILIFGCNAVSCNAFDGRCVRRRALFFPIASNPPAGHKKAVGFD